MNDKDLEVNPCPKTIPDDEALEKITLINMVDLICIGRTCPSCALSSDTRKSSVCCPEFRDKYPEECRPLALGYLKFLRDEFQKKVDEWEVVF